MTNKYQRIRKGRRSGKGRSLGQREILENDINVEKEKRGREIQRDRHQANIVQSSLFVTQ